MMASRLVQRLLYPIILMLASTNRYKESCHQMRMLQVPELKHAMGMRGMKFPHGTRRDRIRMIGNAVCPPVMRSVLKQLIKPRNA